MSVFTRPRAARAAADISIEARADSGNELSAAAYALRSGKGTTGFVSRTDAQRVSTVYACARLHADTISTLPVHNYRTGPDGLMSDVPPPGWVRRPNPDQRWTEWLDMVVMSCMYDGEAFALITPDPTTQLPVALSLLDAKCMVDTPDGNWSYDGKPIPARLIWQVKTIPSANPRRGMSPLALARLSIATALAGRQYVSQFFSDGGHPSVEIVSELPDLTGEQATEIKAGAMASMTGREPWVHGSGLTSKTWQVSPADAAFLDVMGVTDLDVCRFMGVRQPELVGVPMQGGSTVNYTNNEQRGTAFQQFTIGPFIRRLDEALSDDQLSVPGDALELDASAFLRGDQATEARIEDTRLRNGSASRNEIRRRHNEPPVPGGDEYLWPPYRAFPLPSDSGGEM